ncbi:MAG: D-aminoacylase [Acidimicrobiia bacterium]
MDADLVVTGGTVIDGTGSPPRRADIAVEGDTIDVVDPLPEPVDATDTLDAEGLVVTPGFIDVHLHTDTAALSPDPDTNGGLPSLRQGVTTEVCGNCGFSPFPIHGDAAEELGVLISTALGEGARLFRDAPSHRAALEEMGLGPNYAPLVGHGALRISAVGFDDRPATADEIATMCAELDSALAEGCFGMSTGLIYPPGMFAPTEEIVELARVVTRHELLYTTHMRNENTFVDEAIEEAFTIGRESGAPVQISHHKVTGPPNWGRSEETLRQIDDARAEGLDVAFDVYPYTASSTGLVALLPRWVLDGGFSSLDALRDASARDRIREEARAARPGAGSAVVTAPDIVVLSSVPADPALEGRRLSEIADERGVDALDVACDLLLEEPAVQVVVHQMSDTDVERILTHPLAMIGSDGAMGGGRPHPRRAGTFARVLGRYVRVEGALDLVDAVHKMSGAPAERFRMSDRGTLAPGKRADLVVFDPGAVIDGATYEDPLARPTGVSHVVVNGRVAIKDGNDTGRRPGRVLEPT